MLKVVTLLKRKAGSRVEDFQDYWRSTHGPLIAASAYVLRYVQSHALIQGYRKGELLFDGISEAWFASRAAYESFRGSEQAQKIAEDARRFTEADCTVVMPVEVHVIKDGAIPPNAVKNIEFVNRRPGMALRPFRDYWRNVHGPIASRILVIARYEQNHLQEYVYDAPETPRYDGLAITWFASTADMKKGATTPEYEVTRADEPNFLPAGHLPIIITQEVLIKG